MSVIGREPTDWDKFSEGMIDAYAPIGDFVRRLDWAKEEVHDKLYIKAQELSSPQLSDLQIAKHMYTITQLAHKIWQEKAKELSPSSDGPEYTKLFESFIQGVDKAFDNDLILDDTLEKILRQQIKIDGYQ